MSGMKKLGGVTAIMSLAMLFVGSTIGLSEQKNDVVSLKELIFKKFDADHDGALMGSETDGARNFLKGIDKNSNGEISDEERAEAIGELKLMPNPEVIPTPPVKKKSLPTALKQMSDPVVVPIPLRHMPDPFADDPATIEIKEPNPKDWWIFPVGTIDAFCQDWYSKHLVAAKEAKIHGDTKSTHYRFTWLRTFDAPFIFHIEEHPADGFKITTTKLTGKGGYEPGNIEFKRTEKLNENQISELRNLLSSIKFWELSVQDPDGGGLDGAQWIIEVVDGHKYHVVDRWSAGVLEEIGMWFMQISKVKVPKEDLY